MDKSENKKQGRRIFRIVFITVLVTALIIVANFNFFLEIDVQKNQEINSAAISQDTKKDNTIEGRSYLIIYDENDIYSIATRDVMTRMIKIAKTPYSVCDIKSMGSIDDDCHVILTVNDWQYFEEEINVLFKAVKNGASLITTAVSSYDEIFKANSDKLGIKAFGSKVQNQGIVVKDDIMLGCINGDTLDATITDDINIIQVEESARVYIESEGSVPIYYTVNYGEGKIGVYNGSSINERNFEGIILGMLGSLNGDFIYPIINAGVVFIDDWPGPFKGDYDTIYDQYGMSFEEFLKYVWWPDIVSFMKKYGIVYTGQYINNYEGVIKEEFDVDSSKLDTTMFYYGQQLIKNGCEIGLHGYNHQPLWFSKYTSEELLSYKFWQSKEDALQGLKYAIECFKSAFPEYKLNCYVPPSNVIDEEGIEVVKEALGTPVIISGLYVGDDPETPQYEFEYKDGVIYFPRISAASVLNDREKTIMASAMSEYGVVSYFIHPDDVIDKDRNQGLDWGGLRSEIESIYEFAKERYPYLEYMTVTEAANNLLDWQNASYNLSYSTNAITITRNDTADSLSYILRTEKKVIDGDGYTYETAGKDSYYIKVNAKTVKINLEGSD